MLVYQKEVQTNIFGELDLPQNVQSNLINN